MVFLTNHVNHILSHKSEYPRFTKKLNLKKKTFQAFSHLGFLLFSHVFLEIFFPLFRVSYLHLIYTTSTFLKVPFFNQASKYGGIVKGSCCCHRRHLRILISRFWAARWLFSRPVLVPVMMVMVVPGFFRFGCVGADHHLGLVTDLFRWSVPITSALVFAARSRIRWATRVTVPVMPDGPGSGVFPKVNGRNFEYG